MEKVNELLLALVGDGSNDEKSSDEEENQIAENNI